MIKTKFVFAVSLVAMLAVSSAWANDPADTSSTTDTVATEHTVYTNQTPTSGTGIAGVSYVNKAVNKAGASAQAAEAHAAAAGQSALNAASSAAAAAASAKSANDALANKQDKSTAVKVTTSGTAVGSATVPVYVDDTGTVKPITSYSGKAASATTADSATKATQDGNGKVIADTYATKAELKILGDDQSELVTAVNEKQDKLTAGANITIADDGTISAKDTVYTLPTASDTTLGGVKVDTALSSTSTNPVQNKVINTALSGKLSTSGTAAKATADASGNNIVNTYATKTALSEGLATKQATLTTSNIKGSGSVTVGISDGVITVSGTDNNTTYSTGTATTSGLTKLYTGTGTNTDGTMTQAALNTALSGKLSTSGTAAKATADASGNNIVNTYATKTALSEGLATKQATLTTSNIKGSGSVTVGISDGVITVSGTDNNTTYSTGTATTSGLTKLYTGTGTNTDGTMTQAALNTALAGKLSTSGNAASATKATQDGNGKVIADTYATKAELKILGDDQSELVTAVNEKQDALTATGSANRPVYAVDGGVAAVTGMSIPYGAESNPSSWATIWVE